MTHIGNSFSNRGARTGLLLAVALALATLVRAAAPEPPPAAAVYKIQSSDTLQFVVFQEPDLSVKVKVSSEGDIQFPLLGNVPVAGLTGPEVERKITERLARGYLVKPLVSVTVERGATTTKQEVLVFGQVKSPGAYEIKPDESLSLLQLIARAGGFTSIAAKSKVTILRTENGQKHQFIVDVTAIIRNEKKSNDVKLQPGDVITVPESLF